MDIAANRFTVTREISCGKTFFVVEGVFPIVRARIANEAFRAVFPSKAKAVALAERYSRAVFEDVMDYLETRSRRVEIAQAYCAARAARHAADTQMGFAF